MNQLTASLLLAIAAFVWGAGFIGQETAMYNIGPFLFCGLRFLIAGFVLLPFALIEHKKHQTLTKLGVRPLLILGIVFFCGMMLQQIGIVESNATKSGFLTGIYVLMVPLLLFVFWRKSIHFGVYLCAVFVVLGLLFLSNHEHINFNSGDYIIIISTVFWGLHIILIGMYVSNIQAPLVIACGQFLVTGLLGIITHFIAEPIFAFEPIISVAVITAAWRELLFTALISGVIGFGLQIIAQRYVAPTLAAVILSLEALFAALLGAIILNEQLPTQGYIGCGLIFIAVVVAQLIPQPKNVS